MTMRKGWIAAVALAVGCATGQAALAGPEGKAPPSETRVNINAASKAELMKLAGVGPAMAERIIAFREAHGPFKRVQDLEKVEGVGGGVLRKNERRLSVR
jgi:competence protein ComEA